MCASETMRTRQPSESRICLTALPPEALLSRTRMPTCRTTGVGLVLTIPSMPQESRGGGFEIKRLRRIRQGRNDATHNAERESLPHYVVAAREPALQTGAVPKNSINA